VFPKIMIPQNERFIMENPIKTDDLGVPLFSETPIYIDLNDIFVEVIDCSCETLKQITDIICFARHHSSLSSKISL